MKNAIKFSKVKGQIEIKRDYSYENGLLIVEVKDQGVGIAPNERQKLFTHFGKLDRTAEINHEGIGLGLIIVKKIIESVGGTITVFSDGIDYGSLFKFVIPLEEVPSDDSHIHLLTDS